jgi:hypothetical protein
MFPLASTAIAALAIRWLGTAGECDIIPCRLGGGFPFGGEFSKIHPSTRREMAGGVFCAGLVNRAAWGAFLKTGGFGNKKTAGKIAFTGRLNCGSLNY